MGQAQKRLKRARHLRHLIGAEFARLESGAIHIQDALAAPSDALKRIRIIDALKHVPGLGEKGIERILHKETGIYPPKRIGDLSKKERDELIAALPDRAKN